MLSERHATVKNVMANRATFKNVTVQCGYARHCSEVGPRNHLARNLSEWSHKYYDFILLLSSALVREVMQSAPSIHPSVCFHSIFDLDRGQFV